MSKRNRKKRQVGPTKAPAVVPPTPRPEAEVFADLERLCTSPGFVHVVAYFCFRDNTVGFADELTANDLAPRYSWDRLIRNEIATLMGLMVKAPMDFAIPTADQMGSYIEAAQRLLEELHQSMMAPWNAFFRSEALAAGGNPFATGAALREPIVYAAESAYSFQYRELAPRKYANDAAWLLSQKGIDISTCNAVLRAASAYLERKHMDHLIGLKDIDPDHWTFLPPFVLSLTDIATEAGTEPEVVERLLSAFTLKAETLNPAFQSLSDFNEVNAYPVLRDPQGQYLVLQYQALAEALYETPFFWMTADKGYAATALDHRGKFAEVFSEERLKRVFGHTRVYRGVRIEEAKGKLIGEIDTLALFGDRALVVQAKAKRLTIEARKGNDLQLKDDFKNAVQDAAERALICSRALQDGRCNFIAADDTEIQFEHAPARIFPICIVADHYPALSFQARQFLKHDAVDGIAAPLVSDVFALDAMTEMLTSPLRLISYLELRAKFGDQLMASHELTLLSYHLKRNLWVDGQYTMMTLADDIAADLDVAMAVRREGLPGADTPDGILTRFAGTHYERILAEIEANPNPAAIALGLLLMELGQKTIETINAGIDRISASALGDRNVHDFSCGFESGSSGITIHCTGAADREARARLEAHCTSRKYIGKAASWVGVLLAPDASLRGVLKIDWPWVYDERLEQLTAPMRKAAAARGKKVGRNDPCPCGSGNKHKRCCL